MRMIEALGVQAEAEDFLADDFRAAVERQGAGRVQIPLEQIRIGLVVEAVVFDLLTPGQRRVEASRPHVAVEGDRRSEPRLVVRLETLGHIEGTTRPLRLTQSAPPVYGRDQ